MPLPLIVSCFSKIQIGFTFLVPAHPGGPEKRAVKRVCVCVCVCCATFWSMLSYLLVLQLYHNDARYLHRFNVESNSLDVIHRSLCSSSVLLKSHRMHSEPKLWPRYNEVIYPPSLPNEPLRPAVSGVHWLSISDIALLGSRMYCMFLWFGYSTLCICRTWQLHCIFLLLLLCDCKAKIHHSGSCILHIICNLERRESVVDA